MAKQKSSFNSILWEQGDELISIYHNDPSNANSWRSRPQVVQDVKITTSGDLQYQIVTFLKVGGWEVSNHYKPFSKETIEKYKDGLKYMEETKTKVSFINNSIKRKKKVVEEVDDTPVQPFVFSLRGNRTPPQKGE